MESRLRGCCDAFASLLLRLQITLHKLIAFNVSACAPPFKRAMSEKEKGSDSKEALAASEDLGDGASVHGTPSNEKCGDNGAMKDAGKRKKVSFSLPSDSKNSEDRKKPDEQHRKGSLADMSAFLNSFKEFQQSMALR